VTIMLYTLAQLKNLPEVMTKNYQILITSIS
jgi:hypothetical protein